MPRITVDDVEIEVPAGRTLLQALDDIGVLMNGVEIPHYCWHPKLSIDGSCRLCQVEIQGMPEAPDRLQHARRRKAWSCARSATPCAARAKA